MNVIVQCSRKPGQEKLPFCISFCSRDQQLDQKFLQKSKVQLPQDCLEHQNGAFFFFYLESLPPLRDDTKNSCGADCLPKIKNHSKACPHLMRFQKDAFLLSIYSRPYYRLDAFSTVNAKTFENVLKRYNCTL